MTSEIFSFVPNPCYASDENCDCATYSATPGTENRIITQPGKFEGCSVYVPHFWNIAMQGFCNETFRGNILVSTITIGIDSHRVFPELKGKSRLALWEDSYGFVHEGYPR